MTFYLYVSAYELDKISGERRENNLVQIIRERYIPFGAKVEVIDAPQIKIISRKQEETTAQKIIGWIANQPKGTQFKVKDMLDTLLGYIATTGEVTQQETGVKNEGVYLGRLKKDYENVRHFATGGLANYTGPAILHGSKTRPELVLNADDTERFLEAAKLMRTPVLSALTVGDTRLQGLHAASGGGGDVNLGGINIQIEHVQDYNDFVKQLRDDPKFERLVGAMTFDRMTGKSSFAGKNRIRW